MSSSIVLLSGGLDSVLNLYLAAEQGPVAMAMFADYGQRAASQELKAALWFCSQVRVPLKEMKLPWLRRITHSALVDTLQPLDIIASDQLDQQDQADRSAAAVWVPNRNGLLIHIAAAYADAYSHDSIIVGFNREEAASFPDNSAAYLASVTDALSFSTRNHVKVVSHTIDMDKTQMLALALKKGIDVTRLWSCYEGGEQACGRCESCLRYNRAMHAVKSSGVAS